MAIGPFRPRGPRVHVGVLYDFTPREPPVPIALEPIGALRSMGGFVLRLVSRVPAGKFRPRKGVTERA